MDILCISCSDFFLSFFFFFFFPLLLFVGCLGLLHPVSVFVCVFFLLLVCCLSCSEILLFVSTAPPTIPAPLILTTEQYEQKFAFYQICLFLFFFFSSLHQLNIHIHFFLRFTLIDFPLFYLRHFFFFFSPLFPLLSPPIPCTISSVYDEKILSLFFLFSFLPPLCAMFLFFLKGFFFVLRFTVRPVKKYVPTYIGSWQEKYIYMHACRKSYAGCGGMRVNAGQSVL